jgi:hypothetical protein
MLAGRSVGEGTAQARQPRPMIAALAAAGILGPVASAVVAVVQGLLRPAYSFVAHPVVALAAGPSGWVQDLNFVVLGAAMIAFAIGLHLGVHPTRWAVAGPGLFALSGVGPRDRDPGGDPGALPPGAPHLSRLTIAGKVRLWMYRTSNMCHATSLRARPTSRITPNHVAANVAADTTSQTT